MLARAHVTTSGASTDLAARQGGGDAAAPSAGALVLLALAHYLDIVLVVASAPFVLLAGLPEFGYAPRRGRLDRDPLRLVVTETDQAPRVARA